MPELPEVETIARQLQAVLPGRAIKSVQVLREKSWSGPADQIIGLSVKRVWRKAKNIIVELERTIPDHRMIRDRLMLLVHLKMTGQLIFQESGNKDQGSGIKRIVGGHPTEDWINSLPSKHTRVVIKFTDGSVLYFNDQRVFGWMRLITNDQFLIFKHRLPPDVVDIDFTVEYLAGVLKRSTRPVKLVLLDQAKIGGLGNIYVNDALYLAHAKPTRKTNSFKNAEIGRIHKACIQVIKRGIEVGGASQSTYKHINGMGGSYQEEFLVYRREGERCGLNGCAGVIEKIKLGGRGTYFCPKHQK